MVLLLNIGNTHAEAAFPGEPPKVFSTDSLPETGLPGGWNGPVAAACVVPRFLPMLRNAGALLVSPASAEGLLDFSAVDASTLGADRIANAAALAADGRLPAVCVDAGTAITLEIVAPGCRFLGGAILPGRAMMRHALHVRTGLLPEISLSGVMPHFPAGCTADAIRLGTDGILIDGLLALLKKAEALFPGQGIRFAATGGDAPFFCRHIPFLEQLPANFTMNGIHTIYQYSRRAYESKNLRNPQ